MTADIVYHVRGQRIILRLVIPYEMGPHAHRPSHSYTLRIRRRPRYVAITRRGLHVPYLLHEERDQRGPAVESVKDPCRGGFGREGTGSGRVVEGDEKGDVRMDGNARLFYDGCGRWEWAMDGWTSGGRKLR